MNDKASETHLPSYEDILSKNDAAGPLNLSSATVEVPLNAMQPVSRTEGKKEKLRSNFRSSVSKQLLALVLLNIVTAVLDYFVFFVALASSDDDSNTTEEYYYPDYYTSQSKPALTSSNPIVLFVILLLLWTVFVFVLNMMALIAFFQGRTLGDILRSRRECTSANKDVKKDAASHEQVRCEDHEHDLISNKDAEKA